MALPISIWLGILLAFLIITILLYEFYRSKLILDQLKPDGSIMMLLCGILFQQCKYQMLILFLLIKFIFVSISILESYPPNIIK